MQCGGEKRVGGRTRADPFSFCCGGQFKFSNVDVSRTLTETVAISTVYTTYVVVTGFIEHIIP